MGNTPSDSSSSPGDICNDEEEAELLALAREGAGNDMTGMSVTGADGVTGAVTGTGADATGVTGVTGKTTTGAPVAKNNWAASNTKASGGKDATTGKDETTGTGNAGKAEATGGKAETTNGAELTAAGLKGDATNKEPTQQGDNGTTEPGTQGSAPAPAAAAPPKPGLSAAMREAMAQDPPFALDFCGLVPDPDGLYEDYVPDPRIKESRLSPEEKAKFLGMLDQIFHPDTVLGVRVWFDPNDVVEVVTKVIPYLESEPMLIEDLPFDITIVADVHGQLYDLDRVFKAEERDGKKGWENMKFLFLGDYVDRGRQSLEIVMALYCIKMLYPDQVFLLRGNHEYMHTNQKGGFIFDFYDRYVDEEWPALYFKVNESFCYLSSAAIVGDSYFCAHAGISVQAFTRRHLLAIKKPIMDSKMDMLIHDVSWSDPALGLQGSTFNGQRMCSSYFGLDELSFALYNMKCTTLFRGHSIMNHGFEIIGGLCVSLFTATGARNFNDGAVAIIDANGHLSFRILVCNPDRVSWVNKLRRMDGAAEDLGDDCLTVEDDDSGEGETVNMKK